MERSKPARRHPWLTAIGAVGIVALAYGLFVAMAPGALGACPWDPPWSTATPERGHPASLLAAPDGTWHLVESWEGGEASGGTVTGTAALTEPTDGSGSTLRPLRMHPSTASDLEVALRLDGQILARVGTDGSTDGLALIAALVTPEDEVVFLGGCAEHTTAWFAARAGEVHPDRTQAEVLRAVATDGFEATLGPIDRPEPEPQPGQIALVPGEASDELLDSLHRIRVTFQLPVAWRSSPADVATRATPGWNEGTSMAPVPATGEVTSSSVSARFADDGHLEAWLLPPGSAEPVQLGTTTIEPTSSGSWPTDVRVLFEGPATRQPLPEDPEALASLDLAVSFETDG